MGIILIAISVFCFPSYYVAICVDRWNIVIFFFIKSTNYHFCQLLLKQVQPVFVTDNRKIMIEDGSANRWDGQRKITWYWRKEKGWVGFIWLPRFRCGWPVLERSNFRWLRLIRLNLTVGIDYAGFEECGGIDLYDLRKPHKKKSKLVKSRMVLLANSRRLHAR